MPVTKPEKPYDHKIGHPGAPAIECHQDPSFAMACMSFDSECNGQLLNLVSEKQGGNFANYVGYRDGVLTGLDKMAITVNQDKSVAFQIVLQGRGDEEFRCKTLSIDQLETAVADYFKTHLQYA